MFWLEAMGRQSCISRLQKGLSRSFFVHHVRITLARRLSRFSWIKISALSKLIRPDSSQLYKVRQYEVLGSFGAF